MENPWTSHLDMGDDWGPGGPPILDILGNLHKKTHPTHDLMGRELVKNIG